MTTNPVFSAIVPEVLIEENYATWSVCIQNYLLSQDLWEVIEKDSRTRRSNWRKKNAMALHAIQISCGSKLLQDIKGFKSAKSAWDCLAEKCSPQIQGDSKLASSSSVQDLHIPVEEWLDTIRGAKEKKARINESQTPKLIRKVPPILRTEDFKACYEPHVVSIGPYHHNCDPRLQQLEERKPLMAKQFVDRYTRRKDVGEFFCQFEKKLDPSIKGLYDENVTKDIDEEEFKRMMFLDGCFILYFIFCIHFNEVETMGLKKRLIALVQQDLFLFENQLPFQVLVILLSLTNVDSTGMSMLENFTEDMNTCGLSIYGQVQIEEPLHLLHILWIKLLGNNEEINIEVEPRRENENHIKRHLSHGVKELTAAGIHLRPNSSGCLRDIKFSSNGIYGTLTLPRMTIGRSTRQMFLNLMAHEAYMDNPNKFGFTSYICFLDLLIDHAEDVRVLRTAGILVNYLDSDEEVANLFNEIASDFLQEVDTYKEVEFKIQRYLGDKRKIAMTYKWVAKMKVNMASWVDEVIRDHFKSPWTIISLLAGIIVISLASVQTYFTVFPRSK